MHGVLLDTSAVPPNTSWAMVVLGLLGLIYFKFVRPQKRKKDPLARPPAGAALAQQRSVERDMTALLV
ncbi:MAG: hypothetical protein JWO31_1338, partial [Phycisphaerales bacterium]|nr:hypothetical protein [Phycisphaerales bacterium]